MSDAEPVSLDPQEAARQVRAQVRSAQLLEAAARLMERDGSGAVSMQAVAAEAGVSVGVIYRYFTGKDQLLLAVIVDVLEAFAKEVPVAVAAAGRDPVEQLVAAFRAYCQVIDRRRHAALLTYRESKVLSESGLARIKDLEVATSRPLSDIVAAGIADGTFADVDPDLAAYDLLLMAHAWALKHWYFERTLSLDHYVERQSALMLSALLKPDKRPDYRAHLGSLNEE